MSASPAKKDDQLVDAAIARAKEGDMEGLYLLYVKYGEHILRYINSLVKDQHEAEDLTQNVFLKLVTVIHRYEPREVPFIAWVLRVARNMALDQIRDRRAIPHEEVLVSVDDHRQLGNERREDLCWALEQLPEEQRNVLILRHIHGLSPPEIAVVLGKTESAIDGLHHRGRKRVQAVLTDLGAAPLVTRRAV
jgi:RNA polymerase sigma-70 factor, ECF subfamily